MHIPLPVTCSSLLLAELNSRSDVFPWQSYPFLQLSTMQPPYTPDALGIAIVCMGYQPLQSGLRKQGCLRQAKPVSGVLTGFYGDEEYT